MAYCEGMSFEDFSKLFGYEHTFADGTDGFLNSDGKFFSRVEVMQEFVQNAVRSSLKGFVGKPRIQKNLDDIKKRMLEILQGLDNYFPNPFQIDVKQNGGEVSIKAKNLFTGLRMQGIPVQYEEVVDRTEYEVPEGIFKYSEDEGFVFQPNK